MPKEGSTQRRWVLAAVVLIGLSVVAAYSAITPWLAHQADLYQPRTPYTKLLLGAEPRDLGPEDAECAVLLVHGYLGCGNNFGELPEHLAQAGYRVRVMLLPGHGTSSSDLEEVTGAELVDAVLDEIDHLRTKYRRLVLVGHSMGGTLCTIAATQRPVDGLVLAAPYFGVTSHWYYGLKPETWAKTASRVVPWLYKGNLFLQVNRKEVRDEIVSYQWAPMSSVRMLMSLARQANKLTVLDKIACPVTLIHSQNDQAASPEAAEKAFNAIQAKQKRAVWFERSNHILFWDYDAEQAINEVLAATADAQKGRRP